MKATRERGDNRPVIMLTARSELNERAAALDAGADDYLVKPFEMAELGARARAQARRAPNAIRRALVLGPLSLDLDARQVEIDGVGQAFPRREVSLLEVPISAEGRTISKQRLLDHLYGVGADVEESAVEVHISRVRKRLKTHGIAIRVQRGIGFAIELDPAP